MYRNENGIWANLDVKSLLFKAGPFVSFLNARLSGFHLTWKVVTRSRSWRCSGNRSCRLGELEYFVMLDELTTDY